jgi:hypothetical protein
MNAMHIETTNNLRCIGLSDLLAAREVPRRARRAPDHLASVNGTLM